MSLTEQDRAWRETYEQLDPEARRLVDRAVENTQQMLRINGAATAQDDRAEQLVAAVARYLVLSNPQHSDLLVNRLAAPKAKIEQRAAEQNAQENHARNLLKEVAVKHKNIFGTAETKRMIYRYGRAKALNEVPMACVPALHRVLQGRIDRGAVVYESTPTGRERAVGKHPALGATYQPVPQEKAEKMRDDFRASYPDIYATMAAHGNVSDTPFFGSARYDEVVAQTKVAGNGGGFDGGGASGNYDASPSSSDPSPSNND